jgi:hypothetical protein
MYISDPRGIARFVLVLKSEQNCLKIAVSNKWNMSHCNCCYIQSIHCVQHTALELTIQNFWNISRVARLAFPNLSTKHGAYTLRTASILKPLFLRIVQYIPTVKDIALSDHKRQ